MLLLVNERVQHRNLDYANGTPLRQLLALPQRFEISDRQDASSEGRKDVSHLVPSTANIQDTPIKIPAIRLLPVGLCGALAPRDFHLLSPLKKYVDGHICQADAEMQQAVSQWFRLQSPEFRAEGVRLLITHCDIWLNIQGDYVEMQDIIKVQVVGYIYIKEDCLIYFLYVFVRRKLYQICTFF